MVRIGFGPSVTRKVLATGAEARHSKTLRHGSGQHRHKGRLSMKRTVSNNLAAAVVKIKHGRVTEININRPQLER